MKKFNGQIVAKVTELTVGQAMASGKIVEVDKRGAAPVILSIVAGTSPNKLIISGTVAQSMEIEDGGTYLMSVIERDANEYGRQFTYTNLGQLSPLEVMQSPGLLGQPEVIKITGSAEAGESEEHENEFSESKRQKA